MKRWILSMILAVVLIASSSALAEQALSARWDGENVVVTWSADEASGDATLTLYRDGWPVLVVCADYEAGEYELPAWCVRREGRYEVRLRSGAGCERIDVILNQEEPTDAPSAEPTNKPAATEQPAATPEPTNEPISTEQPAATPELTNEPVSTEQPIATPKPTAEPTIQPTERPTQAPSGSDSLDLAAQVVEQVNAERAAAGLNSLTVDVDLTAAACVRAREIVELFSHTRPDGSSWSTVSSKANGENIAMGYRTADAVMTGWMNSDGHRENILRSSFSTIGVCAYTVNGVTYWVQLFGR